MLRHGLALIGWLPLNGSQPIQAASPIALQAIDPTQFNGNTTCVDAFGIKLAMRLHCADGFEATVGEDPATFAEDRSATFQRFIDAVPPRPRR